MDLAESVTATGQLTIKTAERAINTFLNDTLSTQGVDYVVAIDTDSCYVNFGPLVLYAFGENPDTEKVISFLDVVCREKMQPVLSQAFSDLADLLNTPWKRIEMKREIITDRAVWVAPKNYILSAWADEKLRYNQPKIKVKGIKAAKPSTPRVCRQKIGEAFKLLVRGDKDKLAELIDQFRSEFDALSFEDVASPRSISNLDKYAREPSGTPIQVKGALLYNSLLDQYGLKTTQPIHDGDKARFCYLRLPNPTMCHVITAPNGLPRQFGLDQYLDKRKQFETTFLGPLNDIIKAIGWDVLSQPNALEDVFG